MTLAVIIRSGASQAHPFALLYPPSPAPNLHPHTHACTHTLSIPHTHILLLFLVLPWDSSRPDNTIVIPPSQAGGVIHGLGRWIDSPVFLDHLISLSASRGALLSIDSSRACQSYFTRWKTAPRSDSLLLRADMTTARQSAPPGLHMI